MTKTERTLWLALAAARDHLDYCGYGDAWERDCAFYSKLPEKIEQALACVSKCKPGRQSKSVKPKQK